MHLQMVKTWPLPSGWISSPEDCPPPLANGSPLEHLTSNQACWHGPGDALPLVLPPLPDKTLVSGPL